MTVERINPDGLARPSGFSHAVSVTERRLVFLAGQIGIDQDGKLAVGGVVAQFEQALANLLTALAAAGGRPEDLVTTRRTARKSARHGETWRERSTRRWPAWA